MQSEYLNLHHAANYTVHAFRIIAATFLANKGVHILRMVAGNRSVLQNDLGKTLHTNNRIC